MLIVSVDQFYFIYYNFILDKLLLKFSRIDTEPERENRMFFFAFKNCDENKSMKNIFLNTLHIREVNFNRWIKINLFTFIVNKFSW